MAGRLLGIYSDRRMAVLLGLGFASGLPYLLTNRTMKVWARDEGVDLTTVGLLGLLAWPYSVKFLWAPIMDRFSPLPFGRRRSWLVLTQAALTAAIIMMGWSGPGAPGASMTLFAAMAMLIAFFSASQDIVVNAYTTDVLDRSQLAAGASLSVTGYRAAMLATGAGAVALAAHLPWMHVYLIAGLAMSSSLIMTMLAPEPAQAGRPATFAEAVIEPVHELLQRRGPRAALLVAAFIILFKLPDYLAGAMTDLLLLDLGFKKEQIAFWALGMGTLVTIPGVMLGGFIASRMGLLRSLMVFGLAQAASNAGYLVLAAVGADPTTMICVIGVEYFCMGLVAAGFTAFLLSQCDKRYSATQFAIFTSMMGLSSTLGGAPTGAMVAQFGYPMFFVITMLAALPGLMLLPLMRPLLNDAELSAASSTPSA